MKVLPLQTTDDIYRNSQKFPLNFWWQHATKVLDFEKSCWAVLRQGSFILTTSFSVDFCHRTLRWLHKRAQKVSLTRGAGNQGQHYKGIGGF